MCRAVPLNSEMNDGACAHYVVTPCPAGRHRLGWVCWWSIDRRGLSGQEGVMRRTTTTQSLGVSNPLSFLLRLNSTACLSRDVCDGQISQLNSAVLIAFGTINVVAIFM
jgi:hypothetical protein